MFYEKITDPWKENDQAYLPMFLDTVEYKKLNNIRSSVQCCVFPQEDQIPFDETDVDSTIKTVNVLINKLVWKSHFGETEPSVGEQVKDFFNNTYKVAEVNEEQTWYRIVARSIERKVK